MRILKWMIILVLITASTMAMADQQIPKEAVNGRYAKVYLYGQTLVFYHGDREIFREKTSSGKGWHGKGWMKYRKVYYVWKIGGANTRSKMPAIKKNGRVIKKGYDVSTPYKIFLTKTKGSKKQDGLVNIHGTVAPWSNKPSSGGCFREKVPQAKIAATIAVKEMPVYPVLEKAPAKPKSRLKAKPLNKPVSKPDIKPKSNPNKDFDIPTIENEVQTADNSAVF